MNTSRKISQFLAALTLCVMAFGNVTSTHAQMRADAMMKPAEATLPAPSGSARELFSRNRERLVQVRVLLKSANEQSSLGSGFVVQNDSTGVWLMTNYHVVSSHAIDPSKYKIEVRSTAENVVSATLMSIDVIHDLAILRVEPMPALAKWPVFEMRAMPLTQGEKLFALGNPLEVGFLISEGIYNGLVELRIYEQMVFSGAINAGMSGGPAIDASGRAVGVNVATHRMGQLLSFLVPIKYARDLRDLTLRSKAPARKEWRTEIARQLLVHQQFIASKLVGGTGAKTAGVDSAAKLGFASQQLAGRTVSTLDASLTRCWADGRDGERLKFQRDQMKCTLQSDLFVRNEFYTGSIRIEHVLLRNDKLATPQFLAVEAGGGYAQSYLQAYLLRGNKEMTRQECRDEYVAGKLHVYRIANCVQGFRKFEGVYNITVSAIQVDDARERLRSTLTLKGFSFENAQTLSRMFLENLQ